MTERLADRITELRRSSEGADVQGFDRAVEAYRQAFHDHLAGSQERDGARIELMARAKVLADHAPEGDRAGLVSLWSREADGALEGPAVVQDHSPDISR